MASGFFRGTNTDQVKHINAEQKIIKEMQKNKRFPDHYAQKVDMSKVSMDVMKPWIAKRITEMLGFEDDIVVDFCVAQMSEPGDKGLDPKMLQVNLTGFLERKAAPFVSELWQHLLSAQESPVGVPREFIDQKKEELKKKKEEAEKVQEELKRRRQDLEEASKQERQREPPSREADGGRSRRDDDRGRDDRGRDRSRDRRRDRDDDRGRGRDDRGRDRDDRDRRRERQREKSESESPKPRAKRGDKRFQWED